MRIVGGKFKGRALKGPAPDSRAIRPTSDRLREAVFNVLAHAYGDPCEGARTLDLFAGTGALGLEAMSRGAKICVFVDEGAEARACLRANVETLGLGGQTKIFRRDATKLGPAIAQGPFDLVFCDPPYGKALGEQALASAREGGWLAQGALVVWEEASEAETTIPAGLDLIERRVYADTAMSFLKAA
ncbi:16S rRNA (guanine(966)-N(2))-methyltransferase RsmD [Chenggangzhangella methanolivorans]|uniref:16S rRNA (Guanine(966)-N(2))-methyltransferase RsmD n=1 Tax=Chenggangzhangella methanolivorans TaxID=1437009 RepID=A0A9E6RDW0_9HYPH|nr:16S rRNA (guanine(966)-N(2))-methyltransferase RsmD [Chenggangzhangella methanolivorans]QZO01554.1 16S rRNA (guanine(966)-N(2))-methyltransferase RsmD [Chenggangzhangella methanolivorans]